LKKKKPGFDENPQAFSLYNDFERLCRSGEVQIEKYLGFFFLANVLERPCCLGNDCALFFPFHAVTLHIFLNGQVNLYTFYESIRTTGE
jgi:hypothetical protein